MIIEIKQRRLTYTEIIDSSFYIFRQHFLLILAVNLVIFILWNLLTQALNGENFVTITNLIYGLLLLPIAIISYYQIIDSEINNNNVVFSDLKYTYYNKILKIVNVQLSISVYGLLAILVIGLLCIPAYFIATFLNLSSFFTSNYGVGFAILVFGIVLLALTYLFQYGIYAAVVNNKSSSKALEHSVTIVKDNPWESLAILSIAIMGALITDYFTTLIFNLLLGLGDNYYILWIYAFKSQLISSFFIVINLISYLNLDYAHKRKNS